MRGLLNESARSGIGHSRRVGAQHPRLGDRTDYLAKCFETAQPGQTRERLAALAVRGLVGVFVTANFEPMLRDALLARGIEPVLVRLASSEGTITAAPDLLALAGLVRGPTTQLPARRCLSATIRR